MIPFHLIADPLLALMGRINGIVKAVMSLTGGSSCSFQSGSGLATAGWENVIAAREL